MEDVIDDLEVVVKLRGGTRHCKLVRMWLRENPRNQNDTEKNSGMPGSRAQCGGEADEIKRSNAIRSLFRKFRQIVSFAYPPTISSQ
jgi:hypothetical protein